MLGKHRTFLGVGSLAAVTGAAALILSFASPLRGQEPQPIAALIVTGANNHDWEYTSPELRDALLESGRFTAEITSEPGKTLADADALAKFDVFVLDYNGPRWGEPAESNFLAAVRGGAGVTVVHAANNAFEGWVEYEKLVGDMWRKGTGHGRFHAFDVRVTDRDHPLTRDMPDLRAHPDELYHRLVHMHDVDRRVLATAKSSKESGGTGNDEPMIIVKTYGDGRVFHTPLGHVWRKRIPTRASFADPQLRWLIARGSEWAATGDVTLPGQPPNLLTAAEKDEGFRLLFDGRTTDGWRGYRKDGMPKKGWSVEHGALVHAAKGGGGDVITAETFGDFDLRFEWRVGKGANSGVMFRVAETEHPSYRTGPEYQILDDATRKPGAKHSAGALYDMVGVEQKSLKPAGSWNTARIVIREGRLEHWLNGEKVVDAPFGGSAWDRLVAGSKFKNWDGFGTQPTGHIALQDHGDEVAFRSIRIRTF